MNVQGLVNDFLHRAGRPADSGLDAAYQYQMTVLRDLLARLDVILADERIPPDQAARIIRCMLYGSPSPADAELRMAEHQRTVRLIEGAPPQPPQHPGEALTTLADRPAWNPGW